MKVTYDKKVDALYITLKPKAKVSRTKKVTPSVLIDYDSSGKVVGVEVLDASNNSDLPMINQKLTVQAA